MKFSCGLIDPAFSVSLLVSHSEKQHCHKAAVIKILSCATAAPFPGELNFLFRIMSEIQTGVLFWGGQCVQVVLVNTGQLHWVLNWATLFWRFFGGFCFFVSLCLLLVIFWVSYLTTFFSTTILGFSTMGCLHDTRLAGVRLESPFSKGERGFYLRSFWGSLTEL